MSAELPTDATVFTRIAAPGDEGIRIDRFLADAIGGLSRSRVKTLIEAHRVQRDAIPVTHPSEAVRSGAAYTLDWPAATPSLPQAQDIALPILFEDHDLLVLDKPAGLVVHPAPGNEDGTLVNALLAHCGDSLTGIGGERRPGIVHRLDKDTSGVMVVAKTELANAALTQAFAARDLDRFYLALCWGLPNPTAGEIAGAIARDPRDRKRMAVRPDSSRGKAALTRYRTLAQHATAVSLLECRLGTGRTHQIRVHLSHLGHPIVGDPVYLKRLPNSAKLLDSATRAVLQDFPRQALHAARLGFRHPRSGEALSFTTPPPADMQALLDLLGLAPGKRP